MGTKVPSAVPLSFTPVVDACASLYIANIDKRGLGAKTNKCACSNGPSPVHAPINPPQTGTQLFNNTQKVLQAFPPNQISIFTVGRTVLRQANSPDFPIALPISIYKSGNDFSITAPKIRGLGLNWGFPPSQKNIKWRTLPMEKK
jgi:hypothetical protein